MTQSKVVPDQSLLLPSSFSLRAASFLSFRRRDRHYPGLLMSESIPLFLVEELIAIRRTSSSSSSFHPSLWSALYTYLYA